MRESQTTANLMNVGMEHVAQATQLDLRVIVGMVMKADCAKRKQTDALRTRAAMEPTVKTWEIQSNVFAKVDTKENFVKIK